MKVVVIGGGAAGMLCAIECAKNGNEVVLVEKKSSLGNKLKITGKGRCNITFDGGINEFEKNVIRNCKFMYSSFTNFDSNDVIKYFNDIGITTKIERGRRVFPECDDATKVVDALKHQLEKQKVKVLYNLSVTDIIQENNAIKGVVLSNKTLISCDKCVISTGGKSYPSTGSTGDGYKICQKLGHSIITLKPGLVPLKSKGDICSKLQGLTLRNVGFKLIDDETKDVIYEDFGEMLFAHFGITGPVVLSSSSKLNRTKNVEEKLNNSCIKASIDLKPALSFEMLDKRVCRDFEKFANKEFKNSLNELLPEKLIKVVVQLSGISENKKVNQITKDERENLVKILKDFRLDISGFLGYDNAIITCGGVDVKEVNPKTMESKIIKGLYIIGELLDVDAYTGGYNLQIAFSTAMAASK